MDNSNHPEHPDQRTDRPWAIIKDRILESFLPVYISSMLKRKKMPLLIDAYAGPGGYQDRSLGSPIIMLNTIYESLKRIKRLDALEKIAFCFLELDDSYLNTLEKNVIDFINKHSEIFRERIVLLKADAKKELSELAEFIEKEAHHLSPFLYMDPWGLKGVGNDLLFSFLALREKGIETEILLRFPPNDVFRFFKNSRLGKEWIKEVLGDIDLSEIEQSKDIGRRKVRNLEILRRYLSAVEQEYERQFRNKLYHVAIEIDGRPPYFMVFFSEHPYGCFAMGNAMISALRRYAEIQSPLFGTEILQFYEADKEDIRKFILEDVKKAGESQVLTIAQFIASYYHRNIFPVFFNRPKGTSMVTMQDSLKEMQNEGLILEIRGKVSDHQALVVL